MAAPEQAILAEAFANQAEDAVERLVRAHARFVWRVAYSVLRHAHDAEDVVQETFIRVMRHRSRLPGVADERAWLARIAWRLAVDRRRAAPPPAEPEEALHELRAGGLGAEQALLADEMSAVLEKLVAALPDELRAPLQLSTVEEMSSPEIAAVLGIPEATVRTRIFRARQWLKEKLAARMEVKS